MRISKLILSIFIVFLGILLPLKEINAELSEYNINRWVEIIYKYCKNYDQMAADCQECTNYPDNEICREGIELKNLDNPNIIKCMYVTDNINKQNIKKYLQKIDAKYGRDLGQRPGSELLMCIDYDTNKVIRLSRLDQYYFGGHKLNDYYMNAMVKGLQRRDIPNWATLVITLLVWPLILLLWSKRTFPSIPGLEITLNLGKGSIYGEDCPYLDIIFYNNTGNIVYLTSLKASNIRPRLLVHQKASKDIDSGRYSLKFLDEEGRYVFRQIILNTGHNAKTGLPLSDKYDGELGNILLQELTSHRRSLWRTKFFNLEYIALVGNKNKRYKVGFKY